MILGLEVARLIVCGLLGVLAGWKYSSYRAVVSNSFMEKDEKYL
jgi:hypothetical protein